MSRTFPLALFSFVSIGLFGACRGGSSSDDCDEGEYRCDCMSGDTCSGGLTCIDGVCLRSEDRLEDSGVLDEPTNDGDVQPSDECRECSPGEVCIEGSCQLLPETCPCPLESYCDLATNTCVIGCIEHENCASGRICNTTMRQCIEGCLEDVDCGDGRICEDQRCQDGCRDHDDCGGDGFVCVDLECREGCATSDECDVEGTVCIDNSCACPEGQGICDGRCTPLDTTDDCGGCDRSCAENESCVDDDCLCEPAICQPEIVVEAGDIARYGPKVSDGLVYWSESDDGEERIMRASVSTGEIITAVTEETIEGYRVDGPEVFYVSYLSGDRSGRLMKSVDGAPPVELDRGTDVDNSLGLSETYVYWDKENDLYSVNRSGSSASVELTIAHLSSPIEVTDDGLFWLSRSCISGICNENVYRYASGDLESLHRVTEPTSFGSSIYIDESWVYFSTSSTLWRIAIDGGDPEELATDFPWGAAFSGYSGYLYYRGAYSAVMRISTSGGEPETIPVTTPTTGFPVASDGFVYWIANDYAILRVAL